MAVGQSENPAGANSIMVDIFCPTHLRYCQIFGEITPCPPVPTVLLHDYRGVVDGGFLSLAHETKRLFWPSANLQYMEKGPRPVIILVPIFLRIYSNDKGFRYIVLRLLSLELKLNPNFHQFLHQSEQAWVFIPKSGCLLLFFSLKTIRLIKKVVDIQRIFSS